MSVQPLVMVLLGGVVGAVAGPLIGAAAYKLLDTVITRYTDYWQAGLGGILIALRAGLSRAAWRGCGVWLELPGPERS